MLRNLLLTIIMSLCLCTTAYTREPNHKLMSQMTKGEWDHIFECAGYVAGWLDHNGKATEYEPKFIQFIDALGFQIEDSIEKGHVTEEMGYHLLTNLKTNLDRGWDKFKQGEYDTRRRVRTLIAMDLLLGMDTYIWDNVLPMLDLNDPMDK